MKKKEVLFVIGFLYILIFLNSVLADVLERGSNWDKIQNNDGTYNLKIYNNLINFYNGTDYIPFSYGSCGTNCFRDWGGLIYRVSNDSKKAYVNLYDINNNYISSFGFGITGDVGGINYRYTTLNFTWIWSEESNETTNEYIFKAYNNQANFNWTQEYHFYPNQSIKIKNNIRNNLGANIQNAKFWYIQTVEDGDGIWFNGTRNTEDTYKSGEFDSLIPNVKFENYYVFEYNDLLINGFNITDFYLGNGSIIGVDSIRILAIGITKGNSVFPNGVAVTIDPTIIISGGGGADAYVRGDKPTTNYGSDSILLVKGGSPVRNSYLIFNISSIPENQKVDNATLCLYLYQDEASQNISAHHVYADWQENVITWNNQPCGVDFDNSTNCNLTAESNLSNNGLQDNTWQCWDVKNMVGKEYENNSKKVSIALHTIDIGNADEFYSKEYTNTSLTPYLNITYHTADNIAPNLTIISPLNQTYNNATILINISASDSSGISSTWFYNGSSNITYISTMNYNFSQGSNTLIAYANDSLGNLNSSSVTFFIDSISPTINLIHPQAKTYGINISLPLNFSVSDSGIGVNSCWYSINNGATNTTILNCQNTTFNVSIDGSYTLRLFANDSFGNKASENVTFSVITTAPAVNIIYPQNNSFLNYGENVYFNYTVDSGLSISTCQFFGNFDGTWKLNQTNLSTVTSINNFFVLVNLSGGDYTWGIICNDTQNRASGVNYTFTIDTINPVISLTQPTGAKSPRTGIPLNFFVNESNKDSCWYNIYRGGSLEIANTSIDCNLNSTSFAVTLDADFVLNFYANDSAGNLNNATSSFSVFTSSGGGGSTGGGGGGGSTTIIQETNGTIDLNVQKIDNLVGNSGDTKKITWNVKNTGTSFLNDCKFTSYGDYASWISNTETKNLAAGEEYNFIFNVDIPKDASGGNYLLGVSLNCKETDKSSIFNIEILEKKLGFELKNVERISKDKVRVSYSLEELSGVAQNVKLQFLLFDSKDQKTAEMQEEKSISANSKTDFESVIDIDESLEGELKLLVNINSEEYSTFFQENIILGATTGFAIFGNSENTDNIISLLIVLLFLVFAFFVIKKTLGHRKQIKLKNKVKVIKKSNKGKIIFIRKKKKRN